MQVIKKGDKLLMQIIIRGNVREQRVSYAYERNGHLCVYWNGFVCTIEEMKGTTFTVLHDVKHKETIQKNTKHRVHSNCRSDNNFHINAWQFDNGGRFTEDLNYQFSRLSVPNYKSHLIVN